jgi:hypothetical protein
MASTQLVAFAPPAVMAAAASVRVAGSPVFTINAGSGSMTALTRADIMQKNLDNALVASKDHSPSAVGIVYVKGQPVLTMGGFYVGTVDAASAKAAGTTPAILAQKWAAGLKSALARRDSVENYIAQISGTAGANVGSNSTQAGTYTYVKQGRVVFIPQGMNLPVVLTGSLSSGNARIGDRIEARIVETVNLGETSIPAGSTVIGQVTESTSGKRLSKSGMLGMKFTRLSTPDGAETPISAHISGKVGTYEDIGSDSTDILKGETTSGRVKNALLQSAVGAGGGALLGTAVGGIAGGGRGAGRGAWAGLAIGAGLGAAHSLLVRKGKDVNVESGTPLTLQLDAPASISITSSGTM